MDRECCHPASLFLFFGQLLLNIRLLGSCWKGTKMLYVYLGYLLGRWDEIYHCHSIMAQMILLWSRWAEITYDGKVFMRHGCSLSLPDPIDTVGRQDWKGSSFPITYVYRYSRLRSSRLFRRKPYVSPCLTKVCPSICPIYLCKALAKACSVLPKRRYLIPICFDCIVLGAGQPGVKPQCKIRSAKVWISMYILMGVYISR